MDEVTERQDSLEPWAHLWQPPGLPPRWVLWNAQPDTMVFDMELNIPACVDDTLRPEVLRRMRAAGVPETDDYPGRRCS
ncbi:hypothetical protein [Streptomyces sp. NPDC093094]|uniref:hypothetical protein n=1 Tax=Streptomyces sp. NPDC093094 TaxID=3366026 RepID=UPI003808893E